MSELEEILKLAVEKRASDIHIKPGIPPVYRINGRLVAFKEAKRLSPAEIREMALSMMNEGQKVRFGQFMEIDMAYGVSGLGRFRVNVYQQRGSTALSFRLIPFTVGSFEELHLPRVMESIALERRGLILVTGTTGSGKSTTLAAMVDYINNNRTCHIVTIEDPIEFLLKDKMSIISQREVGFDTTSFSMALRAALRQDPDVILVGEMRDLETVETALMAAETGHLVLSTLHTMDVVETVNRIISLFPAYQQDQVRFQLSMILSAVVSMRLVPMADGKGRVPAIEVMVTTARIRGAIQHKEKTHEVRDAMEQGASQYGMQTFDQSLMDLVKRKLVTYEEALAQSSNPSDFALKAKGFSTVGDMAWEEFATTTKEQSQPKMVIERFSK
jgi:twitching motility protein PilT